MVIRHIPQNLPPKIDCRNFLKDLTAAYNNLGKLDTALKKIPNQDLLTAPLITKEAIDSSRIEGTYTTIEGVYQHEAKLDNQVRENEEEVLRYRRAVRRGMYALSSRKLGENLLKQIHKVLMEGSPKSPGEFRKIPVHIGNEGEPAEKARYLPPDHIHFSGLMNNWEKYVNDHDEDPIIKIAVAHYQFEAIHPFRDGNGRIGRIIIPLFLFGEGLLPYPAFYISGYLQENKAMYTSLLHGIDTKNDWEPWIQFFLRGVSVQAQQTMGTIDKIDQLYVSLKQRATSLKSTYAIQLLDLIFMTPFFSMPDVLDKVMGDKKKRVTASRLITKFLKENIIEKKGTIHRPYYRFAGLLNILYE